MSAFPDSGDAAGETDQRTTIPEWAMHDVEVPHWALTEAVCVFEALIAALDTVAADPNAPGRADARDRADELRDLRVALWQADRPTADDEEASAWLAAIRAAFQQGAGDPAAEAACD